MSTATILPHIGDQIQNTEIIMITPEETLETTEISEMSRFTEMAGIIEMLGSTEMVRSSETRNKSLTFLSDLNQALYTAQPRTDQRIIRPEAIHFMKKEVSKKI